MRAARDWEQADEEQSLRSLDDARESAGCKFADRCPAVMEKCWSHAPPLHQPDTNRGVRCFLYEDEPVLEKADVTDTFALQ